MAIQIDDQHYILNFKLQKFYSADFKRRKHKAAAMTQKKFTTI